MYLKVCLRMLIPNILVISSSTFISTSAFEFLVDGISATDLPPKFKWNSRTNTMTLRQSQGEAVTSAAAVVIVEVVVAKVVVVVAKEGTMVVTVLTVAGMVVLKVVVNLTTTIAQPITLQLSQLVLMIQVMIMAMPLLIKATAIPFITPSTMAAADAMPRL